MSWNLGKIDSSHRGRRLRKHRNCGRTGTRTVPVRRYRCLLSTRESGWQSLQSNRQQAPRMASHGPLYSRTWLIYTRARTSSYIHAHSRRRSGNLVCSTKTLVSFVAWAYLYALLPRTIRGPRSFAMQCKIAGPLKRARPHGTHVYATIGSNIFNHAGMNMYATAPQGSPNDYS